MKKLILFCFILFLFLGFVNASFIVGNNSLFSKSSYGPGEFIEGNLNLSLTGFNSSTLLKDNFGNSISVFDWLKIAGSFNIDYFCVPSDCSLDYKKDSEHSTLTYNLKSGEAVQAGIYLKGDLSSINSLSFVLNSNASESCFSPYEINFLSGQKDFIPLLKGELCTSFKSYGCFNSFTSASEYKMIGFPYCQKITLPSAPSYSLGAWLKAEEGKTYLMEMQLYDSFGEPVFGGSCTLPSFSTQGEEVSCQISSSFSEEGDYFVCLNSKNTNYPIIQIDDNNNCGFINEYSDFYTTFSSSYRIFAIPNKFLGSGDNLFNRSLSKNEDLNSLAVSYINSVYGDLDCSSGCILPFSITSNVLQTIQLKDLNLEYVIVGKGSSTQTKFSKVSSSPTLVNTDDRYRVFSLNKLNFSVNDEYGNFTYKLYFGNDLIFEKEIYIQKVPQIKSLSPIKTFSNYPTDFNLNVETFDNSTVKSYEWDFGDGNLKTTQTNKITHSYNSTGIYNLKITVTDTLNRPSYKIFQIEVGSAKEIINSTLFDLKTDLASSKNYVNSLPAYDKKVLTSLLNFEDLNANLIELERKFGQAYTQEEYNLILTSLLNLKVPKSINVDSKLVSGPFFSQKSDINLDVIKQVTSSNFDSSNSDELREIVLFWMNENLRLTMSGSVYNVDFGQGYSPFVMVVTLLTNELKTIPSSPYLIVKKLDGLNFEYKTPQEASGYYYFELQSATNSFNFYSTQIAFPQVPLYVSPSFSVLNQYLGQGILETPQEPGRFNYFALVFSIILAILVGIFLYFFLYSWYKNKYENHLFKNQNNLYNLIAYIENAKQRGESEDKIVSNLKNAGWSLEQINYVFKKHKNAVDNIFPFISKIFGGSKKGPLMNENKSFISQNRNLSPQNKNNVFNQRKPFK